MFVSLKTRRCFICLFNRPLHWATLMGYVDTIELMLKYGADVNARDRNQYTPLHVAAVCGLCAFRFVT